MSGAVTATTIAWAVGATAAIGAGTAIYSGNQQRMAAERAADAAGEANAKQQVLAQQALDMQQRQMDQQSSDTQSIISSQREASAQSIAIQSQAIQAQQANFNKTYAMQEQQINRANAKTPDVGAMLSANMQQAKGGQSGTMLTGNSGVDDKQLTLGKNTLLG